MEKPRDLADLSLEEINESLKRLERSVNIALGRLDDAETALMGHETFEVELSDLRNLK